jgi:hypothetical protein
MRAIEKVQKNNKNKDQQKREKQNPLRQSNTTELKMLQARFY